MQTELVAVTALAASSINSRNDSRLADSPVADMRLYRDGYRWRSANGHRSARARRGSLPNSRFSLVCSAFASVSEKVASRTRAWDVRAPDMRRGATPRWSCRCPRSPRHAPGRLVALHPLSLFGVQEDRPFLPWKIEGALQLFHICHHAEAALRVGMFERTDIRFGRLRLTVRRRSLDGSAASVVWPNRKLCRDGSRNTLHSWTIIEGEQVPMRLEMKRMAPGATNTWFLEVLGTDGGVRFSTAEPKTLWLFERGKEQFWKRTELGFDVPFKTITGGSFEVGFPDIIQQMWAAFLMERECALGSRFGCATPAEAFQSHRIFAAALASQRQGETVSPSWERDERSSGGTQCI